MIISILAIPSAPFAFSFKPQDVPGIKSSSNDLKVIVYDTVQNKGEAHTFFGTN